MVDGVLLAKAAILRVWVGVERVAHRVNDARLDALFGEDAAEGDPDARWTTVLPWPGLPTAARPESSHAPSRVDNGGQFALFVSARVC